MVSILHVSPTFYSAESVIGGGEKIVLYVAKSLAKAALHLNVPFATSLLAFGDNPTVCRLDDGLDLHILKGRAWDEASLDEASIKHTICKFDVIFVHQCLCAFGLFISAQARILDKIVIGLDHGGGECRIVTHSKEVGNIFDFFLAYSTFGAQFFGQLEGKVVVAKGPVDTQYFQPPSHRRPREGLVALGRYLPHKGFDRIINALKPGIKLDIIGSRYDVKYFEYLTSISRGKDVTFVENMSDSEVRCRLQSASLFIHASCHVDYTGRFYHKPELLGLAPLEALACGTPCLVSTAGSLPELQITEGCRVFNDNEELGKILDAHVDRCLSWPQSDVIAADVDAKFGPLQYGVSVLTHLCEVKKP